MPAEIDAYGGAAAQAQPNFVSYQGELVSGGSPFDGTAEFKFVITNAAGTTISPSQVKVLIHA